MRHVTSALFAGLGLLLFSCGSSGILRGPITSAKSRPAEGDSVVGTVVDASGARIAARVSLIGPKGSYNTTTRDGIFMLGGVQFTEFTLTATTPDGLIACRTGMVSNPKPIQIPVTDAGAWLTLQNDGEEAARVAVILGNVRVHDFTLRPDEPATIVVPPGALEVVLESTPEQRRSIELEVGSRSSLTFGAQQDAPVEPDAGGGA